MQPVFDKDTKIVSNMVTRKTLSVINIKDKDDTGQDAPTTQKFTCIDKKQTISFPKLPKRQILEV
jgi:hypothetical protein